MIDAKYFHRVPLTWETPDIAAYRGPRVAERRAVYLDVAEHLRPELVQHCVEEALRAVAQHLAYDLQAAVQARLHEVLINDRAWVEGVWRAEFTRQMSGYFTALFESERAEFLKRQGNGAESPREK